MICGFADNEENLILIADNVIKAKDRHYLSAFLCHCGEVFYTKKKYIQTGNTKSCGCCRLKSQTKHSLSSTVEYRTWVSMKSRCDNPNHTSYKSYGLRGITYCDRWKSFENFYKDMGKRPTPKHSIDRIDTNGNYEPSNCRWATIGEQSINKRTTIKYEVDGGNYTLGELSHKYGYAKGFLKSRISRGWDINKALTTPRLAPYFTRRNK